MERLNTSGLFRERRMRGDRAQLNALVEDKFHEEHRSLLELHRIQILRCQTLLKKVCAT